MSADATFHQNLVEDLRSLIRAGEFAPGSKFITERDIAERYRTSRPTANKAISSLVSAGILEVRRGAGTFVRESVLDYDLQRLVSFTDKARAVGKRPTTELIEYQTLTAADASKEIAEQLQVGPEELLIYMERIRLADATPVIFERRHVVARFCEKMTRKDARGSLYQCWTEKCGLEITGAIETIHAVNATREEAIRLQIRAGTACFRIIATGHTTGEKPFWHEDTLYRADVYEFRNRISGLSGTHAAVGKIKG